VKLFVGKIVYPDSCQLRPLSQKQISTFVFCEVVPCGTYGRLEAAAIAAYGRVGLEGRSCCNVETFEAGRPGMKFL
jgi:hypothetical protein